MVNREALKARLMRDEGLRRVVYDDATGLPLVKGMTLEGVPTIGYGTNLQEPLSDRAAIFLLEERMDIAIKEVAIGGIPWYSGLDQVRQQVCCNMAFNMGAPVFFGFHKMIAALKNGDFPTAAREMRASTWAKQVGGRADILAAMMELGYE